MRVSELMTTDVLCLPRESSLDDAMDLMDREDVRHLPIVEGGRLVGVLSNRDLLEATGWLPRRVRDIIEAPSGSVEKFMRSPPVTASAGDSIVDACVRLLDWGIGCLPVVEEGELVGMLTEVDILEGFADGCRMGRLGPDSDPDVTSTMTRSVFSTECNTPADEALAFCRTKAIRHLPVQDGDRLLGIVSDRDLRMALGRGQLEGTPLSELIPDRLETVDSDARMSEAAHRMVRHRIGALPVMEHERMIGMISSVDIVTHCAQAFRHSEASA